ncbi:hypothetical protein ANOM_011671 [Aspergillus nomiae NRRL 13137]|uniref:Uncharacterized protein n=1 Tax=Aspergillus nomiae NRRL (strain ATCC 15546 / NRRL 13137 / CBS 260.88 / M93) TaxID=1509407 RepID=A0A0L1IM84_ASPN3|nr:uncharacterized protein ANOM_011671 [Aspergillus nomiae NRRL 13137]KNG80684.1 hypothetical protein ANOM_011671 [Aspergillus nomiae NRRL 13137]
MSSLLGNTLTNNLQTLNNVTYSKNYQPIPIHDSESTASSPPEKTLPVPMSHHDHPLILPPATEFDTTHKSSRETSTRSHRNSPRRPSSASSNSPWGSYKGLDKDALNSLQEYCSSFDQVRILKRGLQTLK